MSLASDYQYEYLQFNKYPIVDNIICTNMFRGSSFAQKYSILKLVSIVYLQFSKNLQDSPVLAARKSVVDAPKLSLVPGDPN